MTKTIETNARRTTALVTGASSGLGKEYTTLLAEAGQDLIITARREDRLQALKEELENKHGINVTVIAIDLAEADAPKKLYDTIKEKGLQVDTLINNAGLGIFGKVYERDLASAEQMLNVNIMAVTRLTKLFSDDMVKRGHGHIQLVASVASYQPCPGYAVYGATKAYVLSFGEALNHELKGTGVNVSVLSPGATRSEFHALAGQVTDSWYMNLAMMESRPVVKTGLEAMWKNTPSIIPGLLNRLTIFFSKFMPKSANASLTYNLMKP